MFARSAFLPCSNFLPTTFSTRTSATPHRAFRTAPSSCATPSKLSRRALLSTLSLIPITLLHRTSARARERCLPENAAKQVISEATYPEQWPYTPINFKRYDESDDAQFYSSPRITRHIDRGAVAALRDYYETTLLPGKSDVLDLCSSVESYMPNSWPARNSVVGLGMNAVELSQNPALSSYIVRDLNQQPQLPFEDGSFDLVCCALSIDYLIHPRELMSEVTRVLRKNGTVAFSFSDRVFATKAIALWVSSSNEDHIYTVASYFHYTPSLTDIDAVDISPRKRGTCSGDPLFVVTARRV